ncbi:MAG TPA: NADP-dependent oxidoreductase [Pseudonocardia sp.]
MKAIQFSRFGGPEVLDVVEVPEPQPGAGLALVRVHAVSVNPADWKLRAGLLPQFGAPPLTPGLDLAGVVESVDDPSGRIEAGARVFGALRPPGSHAELVALPADRLGCVPPELDLVEAAAFPTAALTAWQALTESAELRPGQRVLVHAAAGGVGHFAVQIAHALGAHVTGTARASKHDFVRRLGADVVVDYRAVDPYAALAPFDVVIDPMPYGAAAVALARRGGVVVDVRGSGPDRAESAGAAAAAGVRFVQFGFTPSGSALDRIAALAARGEVRAFVERVLPFASVAEAHELSEAGRVAGKIVLRLPEIDGAGLDDGGRG